MIPTIPLRFLSKIAFADHGCWEWLASLDRKGYGQFNAGFKRGPMLRAHRLAYAYAYGEVPSGLDLDHLCGNRACVRPDHLEPVTRGENIRRGFRGEQQRLQRAARETCRRGHPWTAENRYVKPSGQWLCRICRRDDQRSRDAAKRAA